MNVIKMCIEWWAIIVYKVSPIAYMIFGGPESSIHMKCIYLQPAIYYINSLFGDSPS